MSGRSFVIGALLVLAGCQSSDVSRTLGARCATSSECNDRCLPPGADYPDGFCTATCTTSRDCPSDANCVDLEGGVCLFTCNFTEDCAFLGAGWACIETDPRDGAAKLMVCRGG